MYKVIMFACLTLLGIGVAQAERIKDISSIGGVRNNQLVGYGIVVGLNGSGDQTSQTPFTVQSLKSMLARLGVTIPPEVNPQLKNVAAVAIHATLPPFSKPGQTIDVTVSSLGNANSLRGGTLLMTPLKGADGNTYAIAQGNLIVGGLGVAGSDGSKISVNIPSVGRIPSGATVEREVPTVLGGDNYINLNLNTPDFTTATRLARAIDKLLGEGSAIPLDPTTIQVAAPRDQNQKVAFISALENIEVTPGDAAARIIVNSRTGTVVIGQRVLVMPAAVTHGSLTVAISEKPLISQPPAFSRGQTVVAGTSAIDVKEEKNKMFLFKPGVSLDEIVRAVNKVGASPGDLVAILEALKEAGALKAELLVI